MRRYLGEAWEPSPERQALIGAYFTHEYSPESAALFNPSIVPHPDQTGLPKGALRFILSLRATGEGHISSITFRTGTVSAQHRITLTPPVPFVTEPERVPNAAYEKALFARKLQEAGVQNDFCQRVLDQLPEAFILDDLHRVLAAERRQTDPADATADRAARGILLLAESNYEVHFAPDSQVSQRVLFPSTPSQSNGIEDARFVRFQNDDGSFTYYATYTAYDGKITLPQLLETPDFVHFKFSTLNGPAVQNKGMALFPRKINGHYAMLSRQDDENILLMFSDNIHFWQTPKAAAAARAAVGIHQDRQLRFADRDGSGLAGVEPRRRRDAEVLPRRVPARPERSHARHRPPARTVALAERSRARRLRAERRLHLRRAAARTRTHHPLRHERLRHQLRHRFAGRTAGRDGVSRFNRG